MPTAKPTNVDAQRILAIMDELKEKLTYLSVATPQVLSGLQGEEGQATCETLGQDLVRQFTEQIRLEELYVVAQQQAAEAAAAGAEEADDDLLREDVKALQKSTLELCRRMRQVPSVVKELRNFQETRPGAMITFLKTLADMQDLTLKRLTTTVEEERSRQELLEQYNSRAAEASRRRQQLDLDLQHFRREREKAQAQRSAVLTRLKAELQDVKDSKVERMGALRTRYESRMQEHQEGFDAKRQELEGRIRALQESNKKLRAQSQEEETREKRAIRRNLVDIEKILTDYDTKVKDMTVALGEHQENWDQDKKKLEHLREHFAKVDAEKACVEAEERLADARRAKLQAERERKDAASSLVQAFWRGIITREQFTVMKRSKKKKGGGKKKK